MAFLTARNAATRLGRDERTIRRWIESGTLAASQGVNGRLVIDEAEVARLQGELEQVATANPTGVTQDAQNVILAHLREIKAILLAQADQIADMAARFDELQEHPIQKLAPRAPRPVRAQERTATEVTQESAFLGDVTQESSGLEIATVFAARHFPEASGDQIGRMCQTLRESGRVPMTPGRFKIGKATAGYALDAAQRRAFYDEVSGRKGFQICEQCPH